MAQEAESCECNAQAARQRAVQLFPLFESRQARGGWRRRTQRAIKRAAGKRLTYRQPRNQAKEAGAAWAALAGWLALCRAYPARAAVFV